MRDSARLAGAGERHAAAHCADHVQRPGRRFRLAGTGRGIFRPYIEGTALKGFETNAYETSGVGAGDRRSYNVGGKIDVTSVAGTSKVFSVEGACYAVGADQNKFTTDSATTVMLQVYFEESPV